MGDANMCSLLVTLTTWIPASIEVSILLELLKHLSTCQKHNHNNIMVKEIRIDYIVISDMTHCLP
jgi:hypothetical protein